MLCSSELCRVPETTKGTSYWRRLTETPDERQKRKEQQKRDIQRKEQERLAQVRLKSHAPPNRLNRETPFLCNIRFRNDLPEVSSDTRTRNGKSEYISFLIADSTSWVCLQIPCDPRMLVAPVHPERLAQFSLTSLEENPRREYIVDADVAIPISMLDVDRFCVPGYAVPLAVEDAVLLQVFFCCAWHHLMKYFLDSHHCTC